MNKKIHVLVLFLLAYSCINHQLFGVPAQVIIVRHGEKPKNKKEIYLNTTGIERAQALAPYFLKTRELLQYGVPAAVYAVRFSGIQGGSIRPMETCDPTAKKLHLPVNIDFTEDNYPAMAKEIMSNPKLDGKNVLICWEHHRIPGLAQEFGVKNPPSPWPGKAFDRTWVIQFNEDGSVKNFQNLPQRLLYGDSAE